MGNLSGKNKIKSIFLFVENILFVLSFLFIGVSIFIYFTYEGLFVVIPNKKPDIPENSVWRPAENVGYWIEPVLFDREDKNYRLRLYYDDTGKLFIDACFHLMNVCEDMYLFNDSTVNFIHYLEVDKKDNLTVKIHLVNSHCILINAN